MEAKWRAGGQRRLPSSEQGRAIPVLMKPWPASPCLERIPPFLGPVATPAEGSLPPYPQPSCRAAHSLLCTTL